MAELFFLYKGEHDSNYQQIVTSSIVYGMGRSDQLKILKVYAMKRDIKFEY